MLILNELRIAKNVFDNVGNTRAQMTDGQQLRYVAMHYFWAGDKSKDELKDLLNDWANKNCDGYSEFSYAPIVRAIIKDVDKRPPKQIEPISITQKELDVIKSLNNIRKEKLLFVILVHAKYSFEMGKSSGKTFKVGAFSYRSLSELFKEARVSVPVADRTKLLHELFTDGYIELPLKVDSKTLIVPFMDVDGEPATVRGLQNKRMEARINEKDMTELAYWYQAYCNPNDKKYGIERCMNCGRLIRLNKINKGLCVECQQGVCNTITCVDCNNVIDVKDRLISKVRCPECAKQRDREKAVLRMRAIRGSKKE